MKWNSRNGACPRGVLLAAIMLAMSAGLASTADAVQLQASPPATIYYTTNGAEPTVTQPEATTTYTNYYVAEGTKITPPTAISFTDTPLGASERISLVPNAGKGRPYVKPEKLKIHVSKKEFEKYVKQKHGKRFKVDRFNIKQMENGIEGSIRIVENKDPAILQLADRCTEEERARRVKKAREVIVNNPELIGLTENEELRERGINRQYCDALYFVQYVNDYELDGAIVRFVFVPQFNFSVGIDIMPTTPEMYAAAQQPALSAEEVAQIVYKDLNIPLDGTKPPKLTMYKYLRSKEPYAIWEVSGRYLYEINAITGKIERKVRNIAPN